jgi:hypothetical protein
MARSCIFAVPSSGMLLACASNEASTSALLWDVKTGHRVQELARQRSRQPYLDFAGWQNADGNPCLAGLVEGKLDLFTWR